MLEGFLAPQASKDSLSRYGRLTVDNDNAVFYVDKLGERNGPLMRINGNGLVVDLEFYRHGRCVETLVFDDDRVVCTVGTVYRIHKSWYNEDTGERYVMKNKALLTTFWPNGQTEAEGYCIWQDGANWEIEGVDFGIVKYYNEKGIMAIERKYLCRGKYGLSKIAKESVFIQGYKIHGSFGHEVDKSENQYDENGLKTGFWKETGDGLDVFCYYKAGVLDGVYIKKAGDNYVSIGRYVKGKQKGLWYFFNTSGIIYDVKKY